MRQPQWLLGLAGVLIGIGLGHMPVSAQTVEATGETSIPMDDAEMASAEDVEEAGDAYVEDDEAGPGYLESASRKLGRGVANIATAPLELIRVPSIVNEDEGDIAAVTVGAIQGVGMVVIRALGGAVEVLTFPLPFPNHFEPLVYPEYVYVHGRWSR